MQRYTDIRKVLDFLHFLVLVALAEGFFKVEFTFLFARAFSASSNAAAQKGSAGANRGLAIVSEGCE